MLKPTCQKDLTTGLGLYKRGPPITSTGENQTDNHRETVQTSKGLRVQRLYMILGCIRVIASRKLLALDGQVNTCHYSRGFKLTL